MSAVRDRTARRGWIFLCGLVPVLIAALLAIYRPGFLPRLDDTVYDTVMRAAGTRGPGSRVVIVDIDERSLSALGQWPWRRDVIGHLIGRLRDMGASAIGLDIIFAESDRLRIEDDSASPKRSPDDVFAGVLRKGNVVLGYALTFEKGGGTGAGCVLHPISLAVVHPRQETGYSP